MNIILYTYPNDSEGQQVKQYLTEHDIAFHEIDLTNNPTALKTIANKSGQIAAPVTVIENTESPESVIVGFDIEQIEESINLPRMNI